MKISNNTLLIAPPHFNTKDWIKTNYPDIPTYNQIQLGEDHTKIPLENLRNEITHLKLTSEHKQLLVIHNAEESLCSKGQDCLLKISEDHNLHSYILLITHETSNLKPSLISRFSLKKANLEDWKTLKNKITEETKNPDVAEFCAQLSGGVFEYAKNLAQNKEFQEILEDLKNKKIHYKNKIKILKIFQNPKDLIQFLNFIIRKSLLIKIYNAEDKFLENYTKTETLKTLLNKEQKIRSRIKHCLPYDLPKSELMLSFINIVFE